MKKIKVLIFGLLILWISTLNSYTQDHPEKIISLGPSITEQLYLLKVENRLIANTVYCKRPPEAEEKEKIGTVVEVNIEKIVSLKPDLVIATSLTDRKAIKKLKNLGVKVIEFPSSKNFAELCQQFLELGKIVGKEKEANEIILETKTKVEAIKRKVKSLFKPKVFIQIGANPLYTITRDSFINDLIEFAGGENIARDIGIGLYSREEVVMRNPDVIIIVTMGVIGEEEREIWKKYETIKAVKDNEIYIIDSYKLCSLTPVSFVESLEEVVNIVQQNTSIPVKGSSYE